VITFTKEWFIVRKACEDPLPLPHNPFPAGSEAKTCWLGGVGAALTYMYSSAVFGLFAQCEARGCSSSVFGFFIAIVVGNATA